ncbi:ubiquitin family [Pyrenophora seminiperda CCB06]|uniref:Ubiquitin family n=1 Tax=Pyrenophora seminiperda CCB06 TaxID=1302712 RepID=A0A3M7MF00_9PLEO|nr:ubiquitin family [Pyrenophora seminiperda CCB06]
MTRLVQRRPSARRCRHPNSTVASRARATKPLILSPASWRRFRLIHATFRNHLSFSHTFTMADEEQTINLKILSPSSEVEGSVNLANVPASTTVKELRSRIQDAVPSKPATDRMRLIYRGRVVANDADTLGNVFGSENIRENKDQSLHLVLRELPTNENPPYRAPQSPATLPTNPFRTLPQPRPNSQPPTPQPHVHQHQHHHPHLPGHGPVFTVPIPMPIPQQLAQARAAQQGNGQTPGQANEQPGHATQVPPVGPQAPVPASATPPPSGLPNPPGYGERPPQQQNLFNPPGGRWTMTYNQVNIPAGHPPPLFPFPNALGFGRPAGPFPPGPPPPGPPPPDPNRNLHWVPRLRRILHQARQEMDNVRTLLQTPGTTAAGPSASPSIPAWRIDELRRQLALVNTSLAVIEEGLALLPAGPEATLLRQSAAELRIVAFEHSVILDRQPGAAASSQSASLFTNPATARAPFLFGTPAVPPGTAASLFTNPATAGVPSIFGTPAVPPGTAASSQTASLFTNPATARAPSLFGTSVPSLFGTPIVLPDVQASPELFPPELFLLSSPQGPVGILFDQHGTYTMAPTMPTLPFQTFSDQFARNRQIFTNVGYQMAQGSNQLQNQLANLQPTPTQQPTPGGQNQNQNQMQNQNQNQPQEANVNANPPAENDRIVNVAGHLWLIFKLAAFVYFFAGGGGLYRPIMLGIVAGIVYLAQVGMFHDQFNLLRHHFEALLPVGAMAERAAQPNNQAHTQHRGNLSPEEAARRILQQRRDQRFGWLRESMRSVERAFALFIASLFPGVGERMVHAQEERERLERVAAQEERQRVEDEARRREEERAEQQRESEKKNEAGTQMEGAASEGAGASGTSKGKERAVTEPGTGSSGSAA